MFGYPTKTIWIVTVFNDDEYWTFDHTREFETYSEAAEFVLNLGHDRYTTDYVKVPDDSGDGMEEEDW